MRGNPKFGKASRKCSKKANPGTPKFGKCMHKALKKKRR